MQLHISKNTEELSTSVADWLVEYIDKTLQQQDRFTIALSGGSTPKKLHELLAGDAYKNRINWSKLHFFWGDERDVPFEDDRNNAKMGFDTLLDHVPIVPSQVHIMRTDIDAEASAVAYENILHEYFDERAFTFDLVFLGMGDDGHTLSLFPGNDTVITEQQKWVTHLWLPAQDMHRITLTAPVVNKAACVAFLVTGEKKAPVLKEVLYGEYQPFVYPSQVIKPLHGQLHWFLDEAAAALIK